MQEIAVWDYEKGRFTIVDNISYEGNSSRAISFCPFCGDKIELKETSEK